MQKGNHEEGTNLNLLMGDKGRQRPRRTVRFLIWMSGRLFLSLKREDYRKISYINQSLKEIPTGDVALKTTPKNHKQLI